MNIEQIKAQIDEHATVWIAELDSMGANEKLTPMQIYSSFLAEVATELDCSKFIKSVRRQVVHFGRTMDEYIDDLACIVSGLN